MGAACTHPTDQSETGPLELTPTAKWYNSATEQGSNMIISVHKYCMNVEDHLFYCFMRIKANPFFINHELKITSAN